MCDVKGEVGVSWTLKYTATVSMLYVYLGTSCYRLQGSKMNSTVLLIKGSSCRISIAAVRRRGEKMEGKKVSSSLLLICSLFDILEVSSHNRHCRTPKIWFLGRKRHEGSYSMEFSILI